MPEAFLVISVIIWYFLGFFVHENMSSSVPPAYKHLNVTVPKEFVYQVELNRPDKLNAINYTLFRLVSEFKAAFWAVKITKLGCFYMSKSTTQY